MFGSGVFVGMAFVCGCESHAQKLGAGVVRVCVTVRLVTAHFWSICSS